jgi:hypothetical protein
MDTTEKIQQVFRFPLFQALAQRRTRRFGLGYEYAKDGTFRYRSEKPAVPLDDVETALLAWAGHGITGLSLGEGQVSTGVHSSWNGRTHPSPCNDQRVLLIIVNDSGVFAYDPPDAAGVAEITGEGDLDKVLEVYRQGLRPISASRPDFTNAAWIGANRWFANKPGSTLFFPVIDLTVEHINHVVAGIERGRAKYFDERYRRWAGIEAWIKNGYLTGPEMTMRHVDDSTLIPQVGIAFYMSQNLMLAAEAIGLGCVVTGLTAPVVLGGTALTTGLGFRFAPDADGCLNPVGLDGIFEGFCPPYKSMDQAVDEFFDLRYGANGHLTAEYSGATPFKDWPGVVSGAKPPRAETIQAAKDFCNYVYETYGRFPATADTIQLPTMITVHHLDTEFYDRFYPAEAIPENTRRHLDEWHDCPQTITE